MGGTYPKGGDGTGEFNNALRCVVCLSGPGGFGLGVLGLGFFKALGLVCAFCFWGGGGGVWDWDWDWG